MAGVWSRGIFKNNNITKHVRKLVYFASTEENKISIYFYSKAVKQLP